MKCGIVDSPKGLHQNSTVGLFKILGSNGTLAVTDKEEIMIQVFSTGTPVTASEVLVGDYIRTPNAVVRVTAILPMPWSGQHRFTGNSVFGRESLVFGSDEIVNLADEESLENPATAMSIWLALREKGAI
jgi:hypothetical protein